MLASFVFLYLLLTLGIGLWSSRQVHTSQDFVLAGGKMPLLIAASALFATWFGSETVLGASSEFAEGGLFRVIEDPFGAALCLFLVGMFYARPLYRMPLLTLNDYYRQRFGSRVETVSSIFMILSYLGWIAAQLVAMALIFQIITGLPIGVGILLGMGIVMIYTYFGGMWAVAITDFIQTLVILGGLLYFAGLMHQEVGGFQALLGQSPPGFFRFFPESNWEAGMEYLAAWITIGLGSIPQQDIFQRVKSGRSEQTAVRASYLSSAMYLLIAAIPLYIALCGRVLYPELMQGDSQQLLLRLVSLKGGMVLQVCFMGALLSAILSTTSGAILAPATVFAENILRPRFPHWDDRKLLAVMRLSVLGVSIVAAALALRKSNIYDLVAESSSLSLVSLFVPLTAGLYWKPANAAGAMASIGGGMCAWLLCEWFPMGVPSLIPGLLASILGMIGFSVFYPKSGLK